MAAVEFEAGAIGTLEASRLALGRRERLQWEINGSKGSLAFDIERLNELQVFRPTATAHAASRTCSSPSPTIPSWRLLVAARVTSSAGGTRSRTRSTHLLGAIAGDTDVAPYGGDVRGRLPRRRVCDAIVRSSASGQRETLSYR